MEAFSGKTAKAVKQDFFAKVFMLTLCAAFAHPIEQKVRKEYAADKNRKHDQKINRTHAISSLWDMMIPMFLKRRFHKCLDAFDDLVFATREIIRPGRVVERNKRPRRLRHMNYKKL